MQKFYEDFLIFTPVVLNLNYVCNVLGCLNAMTTFKVHLTKKIKIERKLYRLKQVR